MFRRFGTRAGIFRALLDEDERAFQQQVLSGPPPLGPGADPLDRLAAYGRPATSLVLSTIADRRPVQPNVTGRHGEGTGGRGDHIP